MEMFITYQSTVNFRAAMAPASLVMPKCAYNAAAGAEAPKPAMPMKASPSRSSASRSCRVAASTPTRGAAPRTAVRESSPARSTVRTMVRRLPPHGSRPPPTDRPQPAQSPRPRRFPPHRRGAVLPDQEWHVAPWPASGSIPSGLPTHHHEGQRARHHLQRHLAGLARGDLGPGRADRFGTDERLGRPAQMGPCGGKFLGSQECAMHIVLAFLVGRAMAEN